MENLIEAGQIMIKSKSVPIEIFAGDYNVILYIIRRLITWDYYFYCMWQSYKGCTLKNLTDAICNTIMYLIVFPFLVFAVDIWFKGSYLRLCLSLVQNTQVIKVVINATNVIFEKALGNLYYS